VTKEAQVWLDAKEGFTEVDKDGDVEYAVGSKMAKSDSIVSQKFTQERMCRKSKSPIEK
jgi:hypothetical protein